MLHSQLLPFFSSPFSYHFALQAEKEKKRIKILFIYLPFFGGVGSFFVVERVEWWKSVTVIMFVIQVVFCLCCECSLLKCSCLALYFNIIFLFGFFGFCICIGGRVLA